MPDTSHHLRATLAELHRQLEAAGAVSPQDRALLKEVMADIDKVLAAPADDAAGEKPAAAIEEESIVDRLADAARQFEESHPTLAGAVGGVINALSRMGI